MMNIKVTATTLYYLLDQHFSLEACEAIYNFYEECGNPDDAPMLGDLTIGFAELDGKEAEEEGYDIITWLDNGKVLVAW